MYAQQGDLIFKPVDSIPASAKLLKGERVIHPGNTGNNHILGGAGFGIFEDGETRYLDTAEETTITHNEHHTRKFPAGVKWVREFVQEYDHFNDLRRPVVD